MPENQDMLGTALAVLDLKHIQRPCNNIPWTSDLLLFTPTTAHLYLSQPVGMAICNCLQYLTAEANNQHVLEHNLNALIKLAALNLSHMENYEWQTGSNWYEDGDYSGSPSRRQLWSVAGFRAVAHGVFVLKKKIALESNTDKPNAWFTADARLIIDGVEL